jgi:hypothetical protein
LRTLKAVAAVVPYHSQLLVLVGLEQHQVLGGACDCSVEVQLQGQEKGLPPRLPMMPGGTLPINSPKTLSPLRWRGEPHLGRRDVEVEAGEQRQFADYYFAAAEFA